MKKQYIWIAILLLCVGGLGYLIIEPSNTGDYDDSKVTVVSEDEEETTESITEEDVIAEEEEESDSDFTSFSLDEQIVGAETEEEFTLASIVDISKGDYHEIVFKITSDGDDAPWVNAEYLSTSGVIRVDLNMMMHDNAGIAYQGMRAINEQGLIKIYHNISSDNTEELYDIGLASSSSFKLESEETAAGWDVTLLVKYPGELDGEIDLGSSTFDAEDKEIIGVTSSDGARIAGYSYGVSGGVLKFVWTVASEDVNPIPTVSASYDSENILIITFDSLVSDKVLSAMNGFDLYGGINITSEKSGSSSIYKFNGIGGANDFKLQGATSPNQVELSIQL